MTERTGSCSRVLRRMRSVGLCAMRLCGRRRPASAYVIVSRLLLRFFCVSLFSCPCRARHAREGLIEAILRMILRILLLCRCCAYGWRSWCSRMLPGRTRRHLGRRWLSHGREASGSFGPSSLFITFLGPGLWRGAPSKGIQLLCTSRRGGFSWISGNIEGGSGFLFWLWGRLWHRTLSLCACRTSRSAKLIGIFSWRRWGARPLLLFYSRSIIFRFLCGIAQDFVGSLDGLELVHELDLMASVSIGMIELGCSGSACI